MPTMLTFSEANVKALPLPIGKDREYHKDAKCPGLQVCVTAAGSKTFYYVRRIDGRPTRVKLGTVDQLSVAQARKAAARIGGDVAAGKNPQSERRQRQQEPTVGDLWEHWLLYAEAHKRPRSVEEDRRNYRLHLSGLAGRRLSSIKKTEVQSLHARIGRESGPYAANRVLALLRAMLNKADEIGYTGVNPAAGVRLFRETARDRFMHPQEMEAFFRAVEAEPPLFRDFYLLLLLTGARKSNVLAMKWTDLDLEAGYWRIGETESKNNSVIMIPLVAPAVAILQERREAANGSAWVFPGHKHGTHLRTPQKAWQRIVNCSGIVGLRIHDLRRSIGSWMAGQNVSLTIVGKCLGHKTPQATAIYARVGMDPQRAAMENATSAMLTAGGVKLIEGHSTPIEEGDGNGTKD